MRTDHEALLVLHRPGPEFLVLLRAPAGQGYWHLVSGGVESGEEPREAALRELEEETGLARAGAVRARFRSSSATGSRTGPGSRCTRSRSRRPAGWEPVLNEEHVDYRWCSEAAAVELLEYPEPREALRHVARELAAL